MVSPLRRGGARRRDGQARERAYEPNKRTMIKVKHERDCDCVVAGFRWHKKWRAHRGGFAAARALRRCGRTAARRGVGELHPREAPRAGHFLGPLPRRMRWQGTPGNRGREAEGGGRAHARRPRAVGAKAKICRGSRFAPSWWSRWLTITCKGRAFVTWRNFADGARTSRSPRAPSRSSKWSPRKSSPTSSRAASETAGGPLRLHVEDRPDEQRHVTSTNRQAGMTATMSYRRGQRYS